MDEQEFSRKTFLASISSFMKAKVMPQESTSRRQLWGCNGNCGGRWRAGTSESLAFSVLVGTH